LVEKGFLNSEHVSAAYVWNYFSCTGVLIMECVVRTTRLCFQVVAGLVFFLEGLPDTIIDTPFAGTNDWWCIFRSLAYSSAATGAYISVIIAASFVSGAVSSIGFILTSIPADVIGDEYEESSRKKLLAATVLQVVEAVQSLPSGGEASAAEAAASSGLNAVRMRVRNKW
jgi:hypothetical protein